MTNDTLCLHGDFPIKSYACLIFYIYPLNVARPVCAAVEQYQLCACTSECSAHTNGACTVPSV